MPIRAGVSPRAWMMKGDATWKAPSAAAPLISVRRLNFGLKACEVMSSPWWIVDFLLGYVGSPGALRHRAPRRRGSGRPLYLAAGVFGRSGGFFAGYGVFHREHVVRIALRRMRLADKHGAHQFVIPGAERRCARLQSYLRRQLEPGK